jgi:hypothetical protein
VLYSFVWVILGLAFGWFLIGFHQADLSKKALDSLELSMKTASDSLDAKKPLSVRFQEEKGAVIARRTFVERVFSYKSAHGILMLISWFNIAGRIFVTKVNAAEFQCYTAPVYKPIDSHRFKGANASTITTLPTNDDFSRLPWKGWESGWLAVTIIAPFLVGFIVCLVYSYFVSPRAGKKTANTPAAQESGTEIVLVSDVKA